MISAYFGGLAQALGLLFCVLYVTPLCSGSIYSKISNTEGNFDENLLFGDTEFGWAIANMGDVDGDGVNDIAVGAPGAIFADVDAANYVCAQVGEEFGAIYIIFLNADGSVKGFEVTAYYDLNQLGTYLISNHKFGYAVAAIDFNKDGAMDVMVGAPNEDSRNWYGGVVWLLEMSTESPGVTVAISKIGARGDMDHTLEQQDHFGRSVVNLGDLNGDGLDDVAVGAPEDLTVNALGSVYILFMTSIGIPANGTQQRIIGDTMSVKSPRFGAAMALLGDVDGDGVQDIAVGAPGDEDATSAFAGYVYIVFLNTDGTVKADHAIGHADGAPGMFLTSLSDGQQFGISVTCIGDINNDGVQDIAVGAVGADQFYGAVFVLTLNETGHAQSEQKIGDQNGGVRNGVLTQTNYFGSALAFVDVDMDGQGELVAGAALDYDGGNFSSSISDGFGAVFIMSLQSPYGFIDNCFCDDEADLCTYSGEHNGSTGSIFQTIECINYCPESNDPCQGNGNCTFDASGFVCACLEGYNGTTCDDINDCFEDACGPTGTCMDAGVSKFNCSCDAGYEGELCNINIDDCASNTCAENATCVDGINTYNCTTVCDSKPCQNHGLCLVDSADKSAFSCDCSNVGWTGNLCETDLDDCLSSPCENGGSCVDLGVDSYECECIPGYTGDHCDVFDCNVTCENNGTCIYNNTLSGYACTCELGWEGTSCEIDRDDCAFNQCHPEGTSLCTDSGLNQYECKCLSDWNGEFCEEALVLSVTVQVVVTEDLDVFTESMLAGLLLQYPGFGIELVVVSSADDVTTFELTFFEVISEDTATPTVDDIQEHLTTRGINSVVIDDGEAQSSSAEQRLTGYTILAILMTVLVTLSMNSC